ncbi:uncharacterized protein LOC134194992 [Corticium candelabrum]|uniref:uncharacterized protein LOC134194992 n=1 Tax=Corticium candelabrum TaxID=121492 RepID=UPI002E2767AE|nr:uncharacterized protein LOC134194992 [Corticium candelabrum]
MAGDCDSKTWDAFNHLMTCSDVERIRKVLARHEFFKMSLEIPGDIVECGVFKGSGLLLWVKLLRIYCPASAKRVIGFDTFGATPELSGDDAEKMTGLYQESGLAQCVTADQIERMVEDVTGRKDSCLLVPGDICKTARVYTEQFPGARISLLHMDLDVEEPTVAALEALWPIVSRGGIIVFDEYAIHKWSESRGVDKFFANHPEVTLKTLPWVRTPSAYCIKP